jgi:hypothetical protein
MARWDVEIAMMAESKAHRDADAERRTDLNS